MDSSVDQLFIRMDRIGDLVLTLPADQLNKDASYHWIVSKGLGFLPHNSDPQRNYTEFSKDFSLSEFKRLYSFIKLLNPKKCVCFQAPIWVYFCVFLARVPLRVGPLSKWYSYLFLNEGLRQKRSHSKFHELDYNLQLADENKELKHNTAPFLKLKAEPLNIDLQLPIGYAVIHPGMSGSALNWPTEKYVELIKTLRTQKIPVVITGTRSDSPYIDPIKKALSAESFRKDELLWCNEKLNLKELLSVLAQAKFVVAPSTGIIHLAASLGTQSLGIYSPVKVQHPVRWAPRGEKTQTFIPDVDCPGHFKCLEKECSFFPCMDKISTGDLLKSIQH